jgi:sugar phosphate isomerase/epimerase
MTARRTFLKMAAASAAAAFSPSFLHADRDARLSLPPGIQLYTVAKALQADTAATLKTLRGMGYREVETAGLAGHPAAEFRKMLDDAGLVCPSAHLPLEQTDLGPLFVEAHTLGCTYATSSILRGVTITAATQTRGGRLTREDFLRTAKRMNQIGEQAQQAGLRYAYHNHYFEFQLFGNQRGYDILLAETDPQLVAFEIDCGWMVVGGASPVEYMRAHPDRFRMLHIKDFARPASTYTGMSTQRRPDGTELGAGWIDYAPIFAEGRAAKIEHVFVEQEAPFHMPPIQAARVDLAYLRRFLWDLGHGEEGDTGRAGSPIGQAHWDQVCLRRSKTIRSGREVANPGSEQQETCPARTILEWLTTATIQQGPRFPLHQSPL